MALRDAAAYDNGLRCEYGFLECDNAPVRQPQAQLPPPCCPPQAAPPPPEWQAELARHLGANIPRTQAAAALLDREDFASGGKTEVEARLRSVEAAYRHRADSQKANFRDTSIAAIVDRHQRDGTFVDAANMAPGDVAPAWRKAASVKTSSGGHPPILLAFSVVFSALVFSCAPLIEQNLGGLMDLPERERAGSIDATFNIARSGYVLSTIGTNSVVTTAKHTAMDTLRNIARFKGLGDKVSEGGGSGHHSRLSFRPIVLVWGPSENSKCWKLGFDAISALAKALFPLCMGVVFRMCCADGAQSGHLGYLSSFPQGLWLQCWVHIARKFKAKSGLFRQGTKLHAGHCNLDSDTAMRIVSLQFKFCNYNLNCVKTI